MYSLYGKQLWNVLRNIFFYVPQEKESNTGLESHEGG